MPCGHHAQLPQACLRRSDVHNHLGSAVGLGQLTGLNTIMYMCVPSLQRRCACRAQPRCVGLQVCANCGVTKTPLWRNDKATGKSYCNACGIYFKTHGRPRPARLQHSGVRSVGVQKASPPALCPTLTLSTVCASNAGTFCAASGLDFTHNMHGVDSFVAQIKKRSPSPHASPEHRRARSPRARRPSPRRTAMPPSARSPQARPRRRLASRRAWRMRARSTRAPAATGCWPART